MNEAMSDELFSLDVVASDSPRLRWQRQHSIRFYHSKHLEHDPEEMPWCAWLPANDAFSDTVPNNPDLCGYGRTEEDAAVDLAKVVGLRLWNEQQVERL